MEWPLVGRQAELAAIAASLDAGRSTVLLGAPGVGKSRLAAAAVEVAARAGARTARIAGTPAASGVPLAAFTGLVAAHDHPEPAGRIALALGIGGQGPAPVLHVDDLHDLDERSTAVLHQLLVAGSLRCVASIRVGGSTTAAARSLVSDARIDRVSLEPLCDVDVAEVVAAALGGPVAGPAAAALARASDGNLLFLRELVEGSVAAGVLSQQEAGLWRLEGDLSTTPLLDELVAGRLHALSPAAREAAEVLAVGEQLHLDLALATVTAEALEELERQQLAVVIPSGTRSIVSLAHPLYAEVVRAQLPALARLRLSRALAASAAVVGVEEPADELRATLWQLDGGQPGDPHALLRAARMAFDAGDTALTSRLATASFDAGGGLVPALLASWCFDVERDHDAARTILRRALDEPGGEERHRHLARVRFAEIEWWHERDPDAAMAVLDEIQADGGLAAEFAQAQRAVFHAMDGRATAAEVGAAHLLTHRDPWVLTNAAMATSLARLLSARVEAGAEQATEAFARSIGAATGDLNGDPGIHVVTRTYNLIHAGSLDEAQGLADLVQAAALSGTNRQVRAWAAMLQAEIAYHRGRLADAQRWYTEGEVTWSDGDLPGPARWCASAGALAIALQGRTNEVTATLERARGYDPVGFGMHELRFRRVEAWALHLSGAGAPGPALDAAAREARADGCGILALEAAVDLVRMGDVGTAAALVDGLVVEGPLATARLAVIHAAADGRGNDLDDAATALEGLGVVLEAAEAASLAARAHRSSGATAAAERSAGRSGTLALACPGAATPLLGDRKASTVASARELQVARLATSGMTNKAIAEHLVVSERTVENHLYRVFAKLGVSSRADLAGVLPPEA